MKLPSLPALQARLGGEKQRTNLLLLAGAAGILLLGLSELWPGADPKAANVAQQSAAAVPNDYAAELEQRLAALLCQAEGAGRVEVMVTLAGGEQTVYAKDRRSAADGTQQEELALPGGTALVESVSMPRIQGVAVLCEGGGSPAVQSRVTDIVQALTGIGTNRITVAPLVTLTEGGE